MTTESRWERRVARLWAAFDEHESGDFVAEVERLAAQRSPSEPAALFELASAHDSTGGERQAADLYRRALDAGLAGPRRRRAVIQYASTLRNLGRAEESVAPPHRREDGGIGRAGRRGRRVPRARAGRRRPGAGGGLPGARRAVPAPAEVQPFAGPLRRDAE